jgi:hypothetical protein
MFNTREGDGEIDDIVYIYDKMQHRMLFLLPLG